MKPDLSSSQAWATCGAMERSRHKFQKPHSYTLYSQLNEYYRILINICDIFIIHVILSCCLDWQPMNVQDVHSKLTSHTFRSLCGLYYQSLCSDSNHLIKALIHCGVSVLTVLPLPILAQARATSAPWRPLACIHHHIASLVQRTRRKARRKSCKVSCQQCSACPPGSSHGDFVGLQMCICVCVSWPFNMQASAHKPWHLTSTSTRKVGNKAGI